MIKMTARYSAFKIFSPGTSVSISTKVQIWFLCDFILGKIQLNHSLKRSALGPCLKILEYVPRPNQVSVFAAVGPHASLNLNLVRT